MTDQTLYHQVQQLQSRMDHIFKAGTLTLASNETAGTATVQVRSNAFETNSDLPFIQQFGLFSSPPIGSSVLTLSLAGDANRKVVFGSHNATLRPTGKASGSCGLYDASGTLVYLGNNGTVVISIGGNPVLSITEAGIQVTGSITSTGDVIGNGISLDSHHHTEGSNSTSGPIG